MTNNKDINKIIRRAIKVGCKLENASGHFKLICPNSEVLIISATPSDKNAARQVFRELRSRGKIVLE
jgi:hypothetical protein